MPPVPSRTLRFALGALAALSMLIAGGYGIRATQGATQPTDAAIAATAPATENKTALPAESSTAEEASLPSLQDAPPPPSTDGAARNPGGDSYQASEAGKAKPPGNPSPAGKPLAGRTIIVDPGHGGSPSNGGATGVTGLKEKDFNMGLGFELQAALSASGANVIMTRVTDERPVIPSHPELDQLDARTFIARGSNADLFISLHANWSPDSSLSGMETYYYPGSSAGRRLAQDMLREVSSRSGIEPRFTESAEFAVLHNHPVPAVLIEFGYMSNARDEARLQDPAARSRMVSGVVAGAIAYLGH